MRAENGFKALGLAACSALVASAAFAAPFKLELHSDARARLIYLVSDDEPDPKGWAKPDFDDSGWAAPITVVGGWLVGTLGMPWSTYGPNGHSNGHDRLLVRYAFDLPPGMAEASGTLQLVTDDNAQLFLNGKRFHTDDSKLLITEQPRSFDVGKDLKPCGNLLALRVYSMNPSAIGYKFKLSLHGQAGSAPPCGSPPTPALSRAAGATLTPTVTATATPRPTPEPTAKPTPKPRPTLKPLTLPKARVLPSPTARPTPKAAPGGARVAGPLRVAAPPLLARLATPLPWPCPPPSADEDAKAKAEPAEAPPRVLARRETIWMGDEGEDKLSAVQRQGATPVGCELRLPFHLDAPARVWAEASRLDGLRLGNVNAAPEVFIDDTYLGPFLAEHEQEWRSPQALQLQAGGHMLLLRCASVADAADLRIEDLRVLSDPLPETAKPTPVTRCRCGDSPVSRVWPARLKAKALMLSVLSGRTAFSGKLATLQQGQAWECLLRLPARQGKALPLVVREQAGPGDLCHLIFVPDHSMQVPVDALGYTPDAWEPVRVELCGGQLSLRLAQAPELRLPWKGKRLDLELGAQDLELGLKPAE